MVGYNGISEIGFQPELDSEIIRGRRMRGIRKIGGGNLFSPDPPSPIPQLGTFASRSARREPQCKEENVPTI